MPIVLNKKFHYDAAHGWLQVKHRELTELNIAATISIYSYQNGDTVYLEEDRDAGIFLQSAENSGWSVEIEQVDDGDYSKIRDLPSYKPT